ncbi:unnamed protein product [Trifolium pratense]|uniref:Uncharacterized protein n=1 Tax=Trifolium pratense TaxID=57577 RepID=A0ACB0JNU1_TRIPR|nr:unnamed protein product [Trifolium pratense]
MISGAAGSMEAIDLAIRVLAEFHIVLQDDANTSVLDMKVSASFDSDESHVNKLLTATFPHICIHSSQKVRKGLVDAIKGLLLECFYTLGDSRLMLLLQSEH